MVLRHAIQRAVFAIALFGFATALSAQGPREDPMTLALQRLPMLKRGFNVGGWFAQMAPSRERFANHMTAADAARIKRLGCTFIRLPVDPLSLSDAGKPEAFDAENLKLFDQALDMFVKEGLAVIVCPYLNDEPKQRTLTERPAAEAFLSFWRRLAKHLTTRSADKVFLQVMNEPLTSDQQIWDGFQALIVAEIRRNAPRHTIIGSSNMRGGLIGGFMAGKPVSDRNVVYDFHFYDPFQFTHQGATWIDPKVWEYKNLPYPSSPENIRPHLVNMTSTGARAYAELYGREQWNKERLEGQLLRPVAWGQKYRVPIICGEFGAYRPHAPEADRLRYLKDVREILEKHNIGWAMWDYLGDFGVVVEKDGKRVADEGTAQALGLNMDKLPSTQPAKDAPH